MAEKSEMLVTQEERVNEAKELFGRGSRNYCMKQYAEAADDLSACCAIYSELHGPQAVECGAPYLLYAKSLIALGKDENNLIVPGDDEAEADEDEDEEEGGEEEGAEGDENAQEGEDDDKEDDDGAMDTNESAKEETPKEDTSKKDKPTVVEKENEDADKAEKKPNEKVEEPATKSAEGGSSSSKDTKDEPQPGPSTSNGTTTAQEEAEDAAGNLQVAWEILELAVKIFEDQSGEEAYENLSECYSELAGISFENSHFQEAINDYTKAMEISKKTNKADLRMLAEVNYKVGLCHLMVNDFDASVKSFRGAVEELEKEIEKEKAKEQTDETKEIIVELDESKNEILEKIADVEEAKKTSIEEVKRELSKIIVSGGGESSNGVNNGAGTSSASASSSTKAATNGSGSKPSTAAAKPANDISHLIKRKKPDSASTEVEGSPAKKTATDLDNAATSNTSA